MPASSHPELSDPMLYDPSVVALILVGLGMIPMDFYNKARPPAPTFRSFGSLCLEY